MNQSCTFPVGGQGLLMKYPLLYDASLIFNLSACALIFAICSSTEWPLWLALICLLVFCTERCSESLFLPETLGFPDHVTHFSLSSLVTPLAISGSSPNSKPLKCRHGSKSLELTFISVFSLSLLWSFTGPALCADSPKSIHL